MGRLWARERMSEFWKITTEIVATNCEEFEFEFICVFTSLETATLSCFKLMTENPKSINFMVQKRLRVKTWKDKQNSDWYRIIQLYISSGKRTCRHSSIRKNIAWQVEVERTEKWKWKKQNMTPATWGSKQKVKVKRTQDDISKFSVRTPPSLHGHTNCIRYKPSFASFHTYTMWLSIS